MAKAPVEAMARVPKSSFYSCSTISKQTLCEKYHISTRYTCILIFFEISENNPKLNTEHSTEAQTSLLEYQRHAFKLLQRYLDTAVLFDELESMSTLEENGNEKEESLQGEEEKEDRTGAKGKTDNTKDINNTKRKLKLVYNKVFIFPAW